MRDEGWDWAHDSKKPAKQKGVCISSDTIILDIASLLRSTKEVSEGKLPMNNGEKLDEKDCQDILFEKCSWERRKIRVGRESQEGFRK